jgi:hypothetical protein
LRLVPTVRPQRRHLPPIRLQLVVNPRWARPERPALRSGWVQMLSAAPMWLLWAAVPKPTAAARRPSGATRMPPSAMTWPLAQMHLPSATQAERRLPPRSAIRPMPQAAAPRHSARLRRPRARHPPRSAMAQRPATPTPWRSAPARTPAEIAALRSALAPIPSVIFPLPSVARRMRPHPEPRRSARTQTVGHRPPRAMRSLSAGSPASLRQRLPALPSAAAQTRALRAAWRWVTAPRLLRRPTFPVQRWGASPTAVSRAPRRSALSASARRVPSAKSPMWPQAASRPLQPMRSMAVSCFPG